MREGNFIIWREIVKIGIHEHRTISTLTYTFDEGDLRPMTIRWPPQSPPSRLDRTFGYRRIAVGAMLFLACATCPRGLVLAQQSGEIDREYTIKRAFLYNFGRYVQWPATAFVDDHAPFVIGVLGTDPFGAVLDEIATSAKIDGRTVVAKRFSTLAEYSPCHILFIAASTDVKIKTEAL